jgi:hypothetical protein
MSTWPNRGGASGGPCGGLEERKTEANAVRPTRSDSSQQASSRPGAVQEVVALRIEVSSVVEEGRTPCPSFCV